jgi:predicted ribosomally synthesized peptide with SipW-like signal peptide
MSKKRIKQYLMLLTVIGLVSIASGSGTFASFSAETTNAGNTFATGTIVLSNTVNAGTACLSTGGGSTDTNINAACTALFNSTVKKPGDSYVADQLDLKNAGSLAATTLTLASSSCTTSDAAGQTYHGTGNLCPLLDVYVQEWTSNTYATPSHCWYGGAIVANTCDFSDNTKTLTALNTASPLTITGGMSAGADRYFTIGIELDPLATNTVQGRSATADLTWHVDQ